MSFDVSAQEMFTTCAQGSCLVLLTEEMRRNPQELLRCLPNNHVARRFLPFVAFGPLAEASRAGSPPPLVDIVSAGEPLHVTGDIVRLVTRAGSALRNQYGPSETHIVTDHLLLDSPSAWVPLPPIGRPIANTQIYILDEEMQPVPVGVTGEIYIGGSNLARGYLERPGLTAERFVPNPFGEAGSRLYRSGDLARFLPDGTIAFLGRKDHQVKLRGFRIELGEIEVVLEEHRDVGEAVVMARADPVGDPRLVAYVTPRGGAELGPSDLRTFLRRRLPEYMVPAAFVLLDAFPLTPSGKLDRRSLPDPEPSRPDDADYVAPRTPVEEVLARIWAEVLGLERVGVHDNFFDIGGHALLATQVVSRVADVFQVDLPLRRLFEAPTVADLATDLLSDPAGRRRLTTTADLVLTLTRLSDDEVGRLVGDGRDSAAPQE